MQVNGLFVMFLLFLILVVYTLIYFLVVKAPDTGTLWGWWGIGFTGIIVVFIILLLVSTDISEYNITPNAKYKMFAKNAAENPACRTRQQQCYEDKLNLKREHDKDRGKYDLLEDNAAINACAKESSTNTCIESVIDACQNAINAKNDPVLTQQFIDFRAKHTAAEVLGFCNTATS